MGLVLNLSPAAPLPNASQLKAAVNIQRYPAPFSFLAGAFGSPSRFLYVNNLTDISYPAACLLIASVHAGTAGHESVTFEMLYDSFQKQVRTSQSAPVQVDGGNIGMVRCDREVMMTVRCSTSLAFRQVTLG